MHFFMITIFLIILLLNSCSSPSLFIHNKTIGVIADQKKITVTAKILQKEQITLDRIHIKRVVYKLNNVTQHLVYEDVKITSPYQFQYAVPKTIGILFETQEYHMIDHIGNLSFFSIKREGKILLLIAQNLNKKKIHLVYGLTEKQLQTVMKHVGSQKILKPIKALMLPASTKAFLIHWNAKMIIIDGLLKHMSMKGMG